MVLSESAESVYQDLDFQTDAFYNDKPPEPWVTFLIGGILSAIALIYWFFRYRQTMNLMKSNETSFPAGVRFTRSCRAALAAYIDNDSDSFTVLRTAGQSFLLLGGIQLDYQLTFLILVAVFSLESFVGVLRVLLALNEASKIGTIPGTERGHMLTNDDITRHQKKEENGVLKLKPSSLYLDLARSDLIIVMTFITQCALTCLVAIDLYRNPTFACLDGTEGCPVGGTMGSYLLFVFGIFLTCVYLLGPKTSFGKSEQNPDSWMFLFRMAQQGMECSWKEPVYGKEKSRNMSDRQWRLWARFLANFMVNGIAFRILIHALAIQVASQSSLIIVVFRVTGMVFIVNMDDNKGGSMTFYKPGHQKENAKNDGNQDQMEKGSIRVETERILRRARQELDALAEGKHLDQSEQVKTLGKSLTLAGMAIEADQKRGHGKTTN